MLVKGPSGSGMSTLLSHWVSNIEQSLPNSCILYHIADIQSSYSIDPVHILRRFLALLHSTDGTFSTDKVSSPLACFNPLSEKFHLVLFVLIGRKQNTNK